MGLLNFPTLPSGRPDLLFDSSVSQRCMSQDRGQTFYDLSWKSHILMHFICLVDHKVSLRLKREGNGKDLEKHVVIKCVMATYAKYNLTHSEYRHSQRFSFFATPLFFSIIVPWWFYPHSWLQVTYYVYDSKNQLHHCSHHYYEIANILSACSDLGPVLRVLHEL